MLQVARGSPVAITLEGDIEVLTWIRFAGRDQILRAAALWIFPSGGGGEDQRLAVGRNCGSGPH